MEAKLKKDPFEQHLHLSLLKKQADRVSPDSAEYWKLRCRYLEKYIDETYSQEERSNCYVLYRILLKREI